MTDEQRIDIHSEIALLCAKLGISPDMTVSITFRPGETTAILFTPNEHGSPYVGEDGNVVTEERTFKVRA